MSLKRNDLFLEGTFGKNTVLEHIGILSTEVGNLVPSPIYTILQITTCSGSTLQQLQEQGQVALILSRIHVYFRFPETI